MNLSRLDGLDSISNNTLPGSYVTTGAELAARIERSALQGLGDPTSNPMIIAAHNIDGKIIFESENGVFYDADGEALEGLGNFFKKVANTVKNVTKTVTKAAISATKVITTPLRLPLMAAKNILKGDSLKDAIKNANNKAKGEFKEFLSDTGKVIKLANKFFPLTILLRNGLLLIMKMNLFGVAKKLKYAYLTDAQATALGIDPSSLSKVRALENTLSKIYDGAGGNPENLKRAIINGEGNAYKNGKIDFNLAPATEYADSEEYRILEDKAPPADMVGQIAPEVLAADPTLAAKLNEVNGMGELGFIVAGAAIASATTAVTGIVAKLKSIGEIFKKGATVVKGAKDAVNTIKSIVPKKEPAPLPDSPTPAQTEQYLSAQREYDDYTDRVTAAGGLIQDNGTVVVPQVNADGTTTNKPVVPSGGGMSTTTKVAIGVGAAAAIGAIGYLVFRPTPSLRPRASLSGLPTKSVTARKKPSYSARKKSKSKVKKVTI